MAELRGKPMSRLRRWQQPLLWSLMPGLLCLTACAGGPGETQPPPATVTPSSPSPSPTPTTASPSPADPSEAAAQAAVVRFWKVLDRLSADPTSDLTDIFTVARGEVADQYIQNITEYRADRVRQVGSVEVENLSVERLSKRSRYQVEACLDVSGADIVDKDGKSTVSDKRSPRIRYRYDVLRDSGKWYVVDEQAGKPC